MELTDREREQLQEIAAFAKRVFDALIEAVRKAVKALLEFVKPYVEAFTQASKYYPKWLHFAKYSKKRRVREKYRKKIWAAVLDA